MADEDETASGDKAAAAAQAVKYDHAFFLDLAAKGRDAWSVWRRDPANKSVCVTFAGVDFSIAPSDRIDFSRFEFGSFADFSGCKWRGAIDIKAPEAFAPGRAFFNFAVFGDGANFARAAFGDFANFDCAAFGIAANFDRADFGIAANFDRAAFRAGAIFTGAVFSSNANFTGATFGDFASFAGAAFGDFARFDGTTFGDRANFDQTHFKGPVQYTGMPPADEKVINWDRNRFLRISFANARFDGKAIFSGRSFEQAADFTNARFYYPPDLDATTNVARVDFTGTYIRFVPPGKLIHWTKDSQIPLRLRALRKIAEETKNHDLERDLYIEERKAERGVYLHQLFEQLKKAPEELKKKLEDIDQQQREVWSNWRHQARSRNVHRLRIAVKRVRLFARLPWIVVMFFYWALAGYGRSFAWPALWLFVSVFIFHFGYALILAPLMPQAGTLDAAKYERAVCMLALGNAVPFVGPLTIDAEIKKFLFCPNNAASCLPPIPPEWFQFLVIFQNLFSITCVFFSASPCAIISKSSDGPPQGGVPGPFFIPKCRRGRGHRAEGMKTYNNFSPAERMRALHWLRAEYDAGKRQRPTKCDACGQDEGPIEAHSEDYSEPFGPHIGRFGLFYRCNAMLHCHLRYMTAWSIYKEQLREGPNLRADC